MNYVDIYYAIHYVVPKVITRNFIDEDGKTIFWNWAWKYKKY